MTPTPDIPATSATSLKRTVGSSATAVVLVSGTGVGLAVLSPPLLAVVAALTAMSIGTASLVAAATGSGPPAARR
jgi:hypothetical protein